MTKSINSEAIEKATGKSWDEWLTYFKKVGADKLSHKEIAIKAHEGGAPDWWAQMVTVTYEQAIGRRVPGQASDGTFTAAVSKTVNGSRAQVFEAWEKLLQGRTELNGVTIVRGPTSSQNEKWHYWHCGIKDGSRINITMYEKTPGKVTFGLAHEKLASPEETERWRAFWKLQLEQL
jgi:hypothetical protein